MQPLCSGIAQNQPKMQLQNSCGATEAQPVLHTEPGKTYDSTLKTPFKEQEYSANSPKTLPAITEGFGPFFPACKSEDEDGWSCRSRIVSCTEVGQAWAGSLLWTRRAAAH